MYVLSGQVVKGRCELTTLEYAVLMLSRPQVHMNVYLTEYTFMNILHCHNLLFSFLVLNKSHVPLKVDMKKSCMPSWSQ